MLRQQDRFVDAEDISRHVFFTELAEIRVSVPSLVRVDQVNQVLLNSDLFKYRDRLKTLEFYFPAFFSTLRYDPDFTVLDSSSELVVKPFDSGANFIVIVSVGVVFSFVVLLVVTLLVVFLYRRKKRLAQQEENWKGIKYDEELAGIGPSTAPTMAREEPAKSSDDRPERSSSGIVNGSASFGHRHDSASGSEHTKTESSSY